MQPDIEFFRQLLKSTIYVSWLQIGLYFLIMVSIRAVFYVGDKKKASYCKGKRAKKVKFFDEYFVLVAICLTLATALAVHNTVTILNDLHDDSYICVHGEYYVRGGELYGRNSSVHIYTEDGSILLERPKTLEGFGQYERENFPVGRCYGTVWYAEHSKIILSFTPDEVQNETSP